MHVCQYLARQGFHGCYLVQHPHVGEPTPRPQIYAQGSQIAGKKWTARTPVKSLASRCVGAETKQALSLYIWPGHAAVKKKNIWVIP